MDLLQEPDCLNVFNIVFQSLEKASAGFLVDFKQFEEEVNDLVNRINGEIETTNVLAEVTNTTVENDSKRSTRRITAKGLSNFTEKASRTKFHNEVKQEPPSSVEIENFDEENLLEVNKAKVKEKIEPLKANDSLNSKKKDSDESIQIIAAKTMSIIELSDDDNDHFVAPKAPVKKLTRQRARQQSNAGLEESGISSASIKSEPKEQPIRMTRSKKRLERSKIENPVSGKHSLESIYEDALGWLEIPKTDKIFNAKVSLPRLDQQTIEAYIIPKGKTDELSSVNTYVVQEAVAIPELNSNETFNVATNQISNETIVIEKVPFIPIKANNSLLTDDDSIEIPPVKPIGQLNNKKELFNPCIESPLKKKIAAFEKHASDAIQSPVMRQTRNKNREKDLQNEENKVAKPATPSMESRIGKFVTPGSTPNLAQNVKKLQSSHSATKLAHLKKANSVSKISRDPSLEDKRRGQQTLADEKKKKNEEKMRQVQQAREAIEKEKLDKYKKIMQEKERQQEAFRKKLAQKKMLEEMNKNFKLADQKREERIREQKKGEKELSDAQRKERELVDKIRIQEEKYALKAQLNRNEMAYNLHKKEHPSNYLFSLICSDDSTDDESEMCPKKGLPPSWSLASNRPQMIEKQLFLCSNMLDTLFSVEPTTPNLKEIFPAIDPRTLQRNSSAVWNTPPRYSQLPKY